MNRMHMSISVVALLSAAAFAQQEQYTVTGQRIAPAPVEVDNGARGVELASPVGTGFTYQGYLEQSGAPATGVYDIRFTLYDDAGVLVAGPICRDNVSVTDGLFTVEIDFGSQFSGAARYIELAVRAGGAVGDCASGSYTVLSPREKVTPTPYALGLKLPYSGNQTIDGGAPFNMINSSAAASSAAVRGVEGAPSVFGFGDRAGVRGESNASGGAGLLGISDLYVGVVGYSYGDGSIGTFGRADGVNGTGIWGWATNTGGIGVLGTTTDNTAGWGGYFEGRGYFSANVGIGTSSPTQKLDVVGTVKSTGLQMTTGPANGYVMTSDSSGNASWKVQPKAYFISGGGTTPTGSTQFLSPYVTVTVSAGQTVLITATQSFGTTIAAGAGSLDLFPAYRVNGSGAVPSTLGGGMFNLSVLQNMRIPMTVSGVVTGLAAGTYDFGMAGDDDGNGNWNNNEWGYISVMVIN